MRTLKQHGLWNTTWAAVTLATALGCSGAESAGLPAGDVVAGDTSGGDAGPTDTSTGGDTADPADTNATGDTLEPDDMDVTFDTHAPDSDEPNPDTAEPPDAVETDVPDVETPDKSLVTERWGGRLWGPILGLSRVGRELWVGTAGIQQLGAAQSLIRAQLGRLDIDTGELKLFESELPTFTFDDGGGPVTAPVSTAGVIADGDVRIVVARTGILSISGSDVVLHTIPLGGATPASPNAIALDRGGERHWLWVSTDHGLVRLDADTFQVSQVFDAAVLGGPEPGPLALDPATGVVYVVVYDTPNATSKLVRIDGDNITSFTPGEGGTTTGTVRDVVWSVRRHRAYLSVASFSSLQGGVLSWDGTSAATIAVEGQLAKAATGEPSAFGTGKLALGDDDDLLIVGGSIQSIFGQPLKGGGLVWLNLETGKMAGLDWQNGDLPGSHVAAITWDSATKRTYAAVLPPCSEIHLANTGVIAISFDELGRPRYERPILSGVRAIHTSESGDVLLGLRDENPGFACEGYAIQTGLVKLHNNRSGELIPVKADEGGSTGIVPFPGVTQLDERADEGGGSTLALGTIKAGVYLGSGPVGRAYNQAIDWGISLRLQDVVFAGDSLWIAGTTSHSSGDTPAMADKGPRGAARIDFTNGKLDGATHFVRSPGDPTAVAGLPSDNVRDVAVDHDGSVWLACATERMNDGDLDRPEAVPFQLDGELRRGGVAHVAVDGTITIAAGPDVAPDPRALAIQSDGSVLVLDAEQGALEITDAGVVPVTLPFWLSPTPKARALWTGPGASVAVALDTGVHARFAGAQGVFGGFGVAWALAERSAEVLLAGTDEGLLRLRPEGSDDVTEADIEPGYLPVFAEVSAPGAPAPQCIAAGQPCLGKPNPCCDGLSCGSGFVPVCE